MADNGEPVREIYVASEVARFCQVDLKTIHNWCERGEIRHFRTPGRHLRFKRVDVLDFLRRYGYPIPEVLFAGRPRVLLVDDDAQWITTTKRALSKRFEVQGFQDPFDALVTAGSDSPDAIVLDIRMPTFDGLRCLARLKQLPQTRHVRTVVFSAYEDTKKKALEAGAAAFVTKPDTAKLKETLESLLGVER
jgi:excisionase family DNA binding protein